MSLKPVINYQQPTITANSGGKGSSLGASGESSALPAFSGQKEG